MGVDESEMKVEDDKNKRKSQLESLEDLDELMEWEKRRYGKQEKKTSIEMTKK